STFLPNFLRRFATISGRSAQPAHVVRSITHHVSKASAYRSVSLMFRPRKTAQSSGGRLLTSAIEEELRTVLDHCAVLYATTVYRNKPRLAHTTAKQGLGSQPQFLLSSWPRSLAADSMAVSCLSS